MALSLIKSNFLLPESSTNYCKYLAVIITNILILCNSNSGGGTNSNQVQMLTRCKINYSDSISVFDDGGPYSFITSALKINETED